MRRSTPGFLRLQSGARTQTPILLASNLHCRGEPSAVGALADAEEVFISELLDTPPLHLAAVAGAANAAEWQPCFGDG